ncbi:hypothetical protein DFAR_340039 [Desulfarculales bacterium]
MKTGGFATATAWKLKEMLRWAQKGHLMYRPPSGASPTSPAMP